MATVGRTHLPVCGNTQRKAPNCAAITHGLALASAKRAVATLSLYLSPHLSLAPSACLASFPLYPFLFITPSQDHIREGDELNRIPLRAIPDLFGARLPPFEYQTTLPNLQWEAKMEPAPTDSKDSAVSPPFPRSEYLPLPSRRQLAVERFYFPARSVFRLPTLISVCVTPLFRFSLPAAFPFRFNGPRPTFVLCFESYDSPGSHTE